MYKYDSCYYHSLVHIIVLSAALSPLGIKALILYYNITSQLKNAYTIHHKKNLSMLFSTLSNDFKNFLFVQR